MSAAESLFPTRRSERVQEVWKEYSEQRERGFSEEIAVRQLAWALANCEQERDELTAFIRRPWWRRLRV